MRTGYVATRMGDCEGHNVLPGATKHLGYYPLSFAGTEKLLLESALLGRVTRSKNRVIIASYGGDRAGPEKRS